jgi:beta-lactam-binding protein with PASTA domain
MRLGRGAGGALLAALVCGLLIVSSAGARTVTVGQLLTPNHECANDTFLQTGVSGGTSYTVPKPGVITSWSFQDGVSTVSGLKLKVGRSVGSGNYKIVADATAGTQTVNAVNTYPAHIPVKAGDLIGLYTSVFGSICTALTGGGDTDVFATSDVLPGTTMSFTSESGSRYPISAKVALDCIVPQLKGKTLRAAKKALKAASCTLGTVTPKGQTTGTVTQQFPAVGKVLAPEAKVNIRLS